MNAFALVVLGLAAGHISGVVGIGGGALIVPALVFIFGLSQHQAQGTTLALLVPPIGLLAAWRYYQAGYVDLRVAGLVGLGFLAGGFFGAGAAVGWSGQTLQRLFGATLVALGARMLWSE